MKYKRSVYQSLVMITQFGISMLVPILLCTFLGVYLGEKFSQPILMVPLFMMGALAGFRNVYHMAAKIYKEKEEDKDNAEKD